MEKIAKTGAALKGSTFDEREPILKKHVGLIHCENKLSLLQRKVCNILLFNALDKINSHEIHEISLKQLCCMIGYKSNDVQLVKKALKSLMSTVIEWNLLEDAKFLNYADLPKEIIQWHASTLIAGASIERGLVRYSYSPQIKTVLSSIDIYGRINLFVQTKFKSSYSLVLYENCVRFKNISRTAWFDLSLFRSLMGVSTDAYASFKELNRNVIAPAILEINQKADIKIEAEYKKVGRQIRSIRFLIVENDNYKPQFKRLEKKKETSSSLSVSSIVEILREEFHMAKGQVEKILNQYDERYVIEKIEFIKKQKGITNYAAYLISALKNDYQQSGVLHTKNDNENKVSMVQDQHYLREYKEVSKIAGLSQKYMTYKFNVYKRFFDDKNEADPIQGAFSQHLQHNSILASLYRKKAFNSPLVMSEFIRFLEEGPYAVSLPTCLSLDDFFTSDEVEVEAVA